jgi:hypothetical protein
MGQQDDTRGSVEGRELERLFSGDSEMAGLMRAFDWSQTYLAASTGWPENLRVAVRLCLTSRFSILHRWGPRLTVLYNDANPLPGPGQAPARARPAGPRMLGRGLEHDRADAGQRRDDRQGDLVAGHGDVL